MCSGMDVVPTQVKEFLHDALDWVEDINHGVVNIQLISVAPIQNLG